MAKIKLTGKQPKIVSLDEEDVIWTPAPLSTWLEESVDCGRWLVPGFIPVDGRVLCSGQKKRAMKSFTTFSLLLGLNTGKGPALFKPEDKDLIGVPVVAIQEESTRSETRDRWLGLCKGAGVDPTELNSFFFAFHERVKLDDGRWQQKIVQMVKKIRPAVLCLDPFYKLHNGDENRVAEMIPIVDLLEEIRSLGTSTIMVAHLDKARGENPRADPDNQVRGTGLLTDDYDLHLALRRYKMSDPQVRLLVRSKGGEDTHYRLKWDFEGTATEDDTDVTISVEVKEKGEE